MAAPGSSGRLVALPLAWLAGVALQLQQRELWPLDAYVLAVLAAALAVAASAFARHAFAGLAFARRGFALVVAVGALALGFAASGWHASVRLADSLPPELEGNDIVVTGVVDSLS